MKKRREKELIEDLLLYNQVTWKDKEDMLSSIRRQANRAGFTVGIKRSSIQNPMLELMCERSGDHKVSKKRLKHEAT